MSATAEDGGGPGLKPTECDLTDGIPRSPAIPDSPSERKVHRPGARRRRLRGVDAEGSVGLRRRSWEGLPRLAADLGRDTCLTPDAPPSR